MTRIKILLALFTGLLITYSASAQTRTVQQKQDTSQYPYWIEMMQDQSVNFYDVQNAFNAYWKDRKVTKGSGWKPFKRWEWWTSRHIYPDGSRFETDKSFKAYSNYIKDHPDAKLSNADWVNLGPIHVPSKGYEGLGRINAIAFHPTNPDILYIGAPAGGCWKYDASTGEWSSTTDNLPTLGVSSIIVDWNNPDQIYIGTGDRDAGDAPGMGVFRSLDGGQTWDQWNTGMGNPTVGRLLQHPSNPDIIYAATSGGIYKTTNAGANWSLLKSGNFKDIVFRPLNPNILYAGGNGNFYLSANEGITWQQITNGFVSGNRSVIAVTPHDPMYVYCLVSNGDSFKGLYRSTDGGTSFTEQSTTPNILSWDCNGGDGGQAWYDLDVACDPTNKNVIFAGGVNCFKSTDGGVTWNISSHWWGDCSVPAVHADLHILEYNPLNNRLYAGDDGGIYYTANGGTSWPEITDGLPISQVYRIGQCKIDINKVINGYQDNGTSTYYGTDYWQTTAGGDGMECAFDHTVASYSYATIYYGAIYRNLNNNGSYQVGGNGVHGINEDGGWITPFCLHEGNSNVMFAGYKNIWRADAIKTNTFTWKKLTQNGGDNISVVEHSPANYNLFYYSRNTEMYRSDDVMDDQPEWVTLTGFLPGSGSVYDIEANPFDENLVYITRGSKVYKSENKGLTWTNITGSLPNINMNCLAYYENSIEGLYVASDAGVYYRDASMDDWIMYSNGLPVDASVNEIEIYHNPDNPAEDVIRAGTYGRGLWSSPVWHGVPAADFEADQVNVPVGCAINFKDLSFGVPTSWNWTFEGGTPATSTLKDPGNIEYLTGGTFNVSLTISNSEGTDTKTLNGYITVSGTMLPSVYFVASDSIICSGETVHFTDMSANCPTAWHWQFAPSTISFVNWTNQNSQNPDVLFNSAGSYSVSLTVTNNAGDSTLTKENYINTGGVALPFMDDFESGTLNSKSWIIENPDFNKTWEIATVAGDEPGTKAASMNFFDYIVPPGPRDRLITPVLDFSGYSQVTLSFQHAYAKRFVSVTDSLIVYISNDCGQSWTRLQGWGENNNGSFATHPLAADAFIPQTQDDWCGSGWGAGCITLDLSAWAGQNNIQVCFESYNYYGNNLFIDNVMISPLTAIADRNSSDDILIYPNPTTGIFNVVVNNNQESVFISVFNMQGSEIINAELTSNEGNKALQLDLSHQPSGVYLVRVINGASLKLEKIVLK